MNPVAGRSESGFALLLVFAMAAILAITLYMSLPRVAFEAQRDKEELLIERGGQYRRAIQLYVRKNKRFPSKMEDLENTNGTRYLRRRYVDPMTGKENWRILHAGPGGIIIDSLIHPAGKDKKDQKSVNTFITELPPVGGLQTADTTVNPALRRRPSDGAQPPNTGMIPADPVPGTAPGAAPMANAEVPAPGQAVMPGNVPQGLAGVQTGTQYPGAPVNSQTGGVSVQPAYPTAPGANGAMAPPFPQPGAAPVTPAGMPPGTAPMPGQNPFAGGAPGSADPNSAARMIQGLLTTPRPNPNAAAQPQQNQVVGGGIAGVASIVEQQGIKLFNEQDEYNKWEFVYDLSKDTGAQGAGIVQQAPQNANGTSSPNGINGQQPVQTLQPGQSQPGQTLQPGQFPSAPLAPPPTGTPVPAPFGGQTGAFPNKQND